MKNNINNLNEIVRTSTLSAIEDLLRENSIELKIQKATSDAIDDYGARKIHHPKKSNEEEKTEADEEVFDKSLKSTEKNTPEEKKDDKKHAGTKESPKLKTPGPKEISSPTFDAIKDKLNILRGGKSLKNPDVQNSLKQYYNGLNSTEKSTLLVLLTGVAQVLAGVESGDTAVDLHDVGIDIENKNPEKLNKQKSPENKKPETTKTHTKGTSQPVDIKKHGEEKPIVVGENQDKSKVLKIFQEYKKII